MEKRAFSIKRVSFLPTTCVTNIFRSDKYRANYGRDPPKNACKYLGKVFVIGQILTKLEIRCQMIAKLSNVKFYENWFNGLELLHTGGGGGTGRSAQAHFLQLLKMKVGKV
jgi:hypothetical protein